MNKYGKQTHFFGSPGPLTEADVPLFRAPNRPIALPSRVTPEQELLDGNVSATEFGPMYADLPQLELDRMTKNGVSIERDGKKIKGKRLFAEKREHRNMRFAELARNILSDPRTELSSDAKQILAHMIGVAESDVPQALKDEQIAAVQKLILELNAKQPKTTKEQANRRLEHFDELCMADYEAWLDAHPTLKLVKPFSSKMHFLIEMLGKPVLQAYNEHLGDFEAETYDMEGYEVFVVQHDWAAAMGKEVLVGLDDVVLPYRRCAFEFQIDRRHFIVLISEIDNPEPGKPHYNCDIFSHTNALKGQIVGDWTWMRHGSPKEDPVTTYLWAQVLTILVMLDSEVAETEQVRQPKALNDKRVKNGKVPLCDYRIVDLSIRHRARKNTGAVPTGKRVRCHFRRGHWVHADVRPLADASRHGVAQRWLPHDGRWRTWIKWQLVGNPDLGFVDHHYKL